MQFEQKNYKLNSFQYLCSNKTIMGVRPTPHFPHLVELRDKVYYIPLYPLKLKQCETFLFDTSTCFSKI